MSESNPIANASDGLLLIGIIVIGIVAIFLCFNMVENLNADKIMVIQNPINGNLVWHTTPGPKAQMFGKITKYYKRHIYRFKQQVRFNDGGHGTMIGSVQYEMPLDKKSLTEIHTKFGSSEAVESQLIATIVNKAIYMTGPLMSSKESYAEKRNYLISYVEDQIQNGVYKTTSKDVKIIDQMTGAEKTITQVEIVMENGIPARQEESALLTFGIKTFNFAIDNLPYDEAVEQQIKQQQASIMAVQTSMAEAKQAEQRAITVAKNGEADAAKSKWEQEVIKARKVTEAQQQLEVAILDAKAAEQERKANILRGEGEAGRKRLIMNADGQLQIKLDAWLEAQKVWADAFSKYQGQIVPTTVWGGNGSGGGNGATAFMEIMGMKAAHDLGLDMGMRKQ